MGNARVLNGGNCFEPNIFDFTYTGNYELIEDGTGDILLKLLTSGNFTLNQCAGGNLEVYLVGGGGNGAKGITGSGGAGGDGGGGGGIWGVDTPCIKVGVQYPIVIGGISGTTTGFGFSATGGTTATNVGGANPGSSRYVGKGGMGGGIGGNGGNGGGGGFLPGSQSTDSGLPTKGEPPTIRSLKALQLLDYGAGGGGGGVGNGTPGSAGGSAYAGQGNDASNSSGAAGGSAKPNTGCGGAGGNGGGTGGAGGAGSAGVVLIYKFLNKA